MAFDLKIVNGDFSFDLAGRIELVRNNDKVVQEVLKLIGTTLGSDPFNPNYGVSVTESSIGKVSRASLTTQQLESEILTGIETLQREQQSLVRQQILTAAELIERIDGVSVVQDESDPRQYNIFIELTTKGQTPITVNTAIRA
jgi:phage baseplate assembly protein W